MMVLHEHNDVADDLHRRAAALGPGYRGRREEGGEAERISLVQALGPECPGYLAEPCRWIDRQAKLFEAGDYPDKGVSVSRDDLDRLAESFDLPAPVLIEHASSPLELGYLTDVQVRGDELHGTVALTAEADALVERSGAHALSLGLSPDLREIREVSLVRNPRVADAKLFSFEGHLTPTAKRMTPDVDAFIERCIKEGKLIPAQAEFAHALLLAGDTITFGGRSISVSTIFERLLERQVPHALFRELGRTGAQDFSEHLMLPEEAEFYRRHFPDISLDDIAQRKRA